MSELRGTNLFDFGLTEAQEERASRIHRDSIIIDMLFQGPCSATAFTKDMVKQVVAEYDRHHDASRANRFATALPPRLAAAGKLPTFKEWWDESGITAGNRQLGMDSVADAMHSCALATLQFDHLDWLTKALRADDIRRAKAEGKHAGFVTCQDTIAIGQDVDAIDMFYEFGLRVIQLTYNSMNFVAAGCTERTDAGVSTFGAKCIERMNKLGIIVDTGHCGHQTTLDACEVSKQPVIASHSCAEGLSGHARGKSDDALLALARTGGVIGVVAIPTFLSSGPEADATVEHFLDHIDYICKLVGRDHVGVGTDWPLTLPEFGIRLHAEKVRPTLGWRSTDRLSTGTIRGFADYREFINITRGLASRGYSDAQVRDILGGNWLRVMDQVWR